MMLARYPSVIPGEPLPPGPRVSLRQALEWLTPDRSEQLSCLKWICLPMWGNRAKAVDATEVSYTYFDEPFEIVRGRSEADDELRPPGGDGRPIYRKLEVEREDLKDAKRQLLIADVQSGTCKPADAMAEAKRLKIGSLLRFPDPLLNPFDDPEWSRWPLPMAFAAFVWGADIEIIRHYWDPWRRQQEVWTTVTTPDARPDAPTRIRKTIIPSPAYRQAATFADVISHIERWTLKGKVPRVDPEMAEKLFWARLQEDAEFEAEGEIPGSSSSNNPDAGKTVPIDRRDFRNLRPVSIHGQDEQGLANRSGLVRWAPTVSRSRIVRLVTEQPSEPPEVAAPDLVAIETGASPGKRTRKRAGRRSSFPRLDEAVESLEREGLRLSDLLVDDRDRKIMNRLSELGLPGVGGRTLQRYFNRR